MPDREARHAAAGTARQLDAARQGAAGYGQQLREKQKVKRIYFVLEEQFRNYFEKRGAQKGITGENLLFLLERRLDNVVYRAGFSTSRRQARQLVNHGHVEVNGRKVDIPSFQVKAGDVVSIKEASRKNAHVEGAWQTAGGRGRPNWIAPADGAEMSARVATLPDARRRRPLDQRAADRRALQQVIACVVATRARRLIRQAEGACRATH